SVGDVSGRRALLFDCEEHRVLVAVDEVLADALHVARRAPLHPELVARGAPVGGETRLERMPPGLAVHVGDHQHLAALRVLGDRRQEAAPLVEIGLRHGRFLPRSPRQGERDRATFVDRWTTRGRSAKGPSMRLADLARALDCDLRGNGAVEIVDVAAIDDARPATITFLADARAATKLATPRAAAAILAPDAPPGRPPALLPSPPLP